MMVFPFLFFKYGPIIRARSRYAQELAQMELEEAKRREWLETRFNAKRMQDITKVV